jgi:hypothetical protein
MKKLAYITIILFSFIATANSQQDPFSALKLRLGEEFQEPKVLWPFKMDGIEIQSVEIDYKFPFQDGSSDLIFHFSDFDLVKSSVFNLSKVDRNSLIEGFESGIPSNFSLDFQKTSDENFCRMISSGNEKSSKEIYLLFGEGETAELLYFKYAVTSEDISEILKIELNKTFN